MLLVGGASTQIAHSISPPLSVILMMKQVSHNYSTNRIAGLTYISNPSLCDRSFVQLQIDNKIATIDNVIEMLTNIIGPDVTPPPSPPPPPKVTVDTKQPPTVVTDSVAPAQQKQSGGHKKKQPIRSDDDSSPERLKSEVIESMKRNKIESKMRETSDMYQ